MPRLADPRGPEIRGASGRDGQRDSLAREQLRKVHPLLVHSNRAGRDDRPRQNHHFPRLGRQRQILHQPEVRLGIRRHRLGRLDHRQVQRPALERIAEPRVRRTLRQRRGRPNALELSRPPPFQPWRLARLGLRARQPTSSTSCRASRSAASSRTLISDPASKQMPMVAPVSSLPPTRSPTQPPAKGSNSRMHQMTRISSPSSREKRFRDDHASVRPKM